MQSVNSRNTFRADRNLEIWVLTILFIMFMSLIISANSQRDQQRGLFASDPQTRITGIETRPLPSDARSPEVGF